LLLGFCDQLFGNISHLEKRIHNPDDAEAGVIHIGTFESLTFYLWPKLLLELRRKIPSLTVRLVSGDEGELRTKFIGVRFVALQG